jgi:hypothetical protein
MSATPTRSVICGEYAASGLVLYSQPEKGGDAPAYHAQIMRARARRCRRTLPLSHSPSLAQARAVDGPPNPRRLHPTWQGVGVAPLPDGESSLGPVAPHEPV